MENSFHDDTVLARWLSGELSASEREALERHPDFPAYQAIVEAADQLALPDAAVQNMWERLAPALRTPKPIRPTHAGSKQRWLWWSVGIAATFTLAFFVWTLLQPVSDTPQVAATAIGEQKTVTLADGTTVRLNAVSSVEIFTGNWSEERRVHLTGEAFFDVKKGMTPFVVETEAGSVSVLGTSFTVKHRGGAFEVACYTGLIQATTAAGAGQALREGQRAIARNGIWQPLSSITDSWPGWMQGESRFANVPLYEVLAELQRQYHIKISASGVEGRRFSGAFVHGDLQLALRMVCDPLELDYSLDGKTVTIRGK